MMVAIIGPGLADSESAGGRRGIMIVVCRCGPGPAAGARRADHRPSQPGIPLDSLASQVARPGSLHHASLSHSATGRPRAAAAAAAVTVTVPGPVTHWQAHHWPLTGTDLFNGLGEEKSETLPMIYAEDTGENIADVTESGSMNTHRDPGKLDELALPLLSFITSFEISGMGQRNSNHSN
jgi:hypothetical protein